MKLQKTPYGSKRLFVNKKEIPFNYKERIVNTLNAFSIWGGHDYQTETEIGWEFPGNIPDNIIKLAAKRAGVEETVK